MKWLFAGLIGLHGLIHLMGFAKAFGYASLPQLVQPISRAMGLLWLFAAALILGASVASLVLPRSWWGLGAARNGMPAVRLWSSAWKTSGIRLGDATSCGVVARLKPVIIWRRSSLAHRVKQSNCAI